MQPQCKMQEFYCEEDDGIANFPRNSRDGFDLPVCMCVCVYTFSHLHASLSAPLLDLFHYDAFRARTRRILRECLIPRSLFLGL